MNTRECGENVEMSAEMNGRPLDTTQSVNGGPNGRPLPSSAFHCLPLSEALSITLQLYSEIALRSQFRPYSTGDGSDRWNGSSPVSEVEASVGPVLAVNKGSESSNAINS